MNKIPTTVLLLTFVILPNSSEGQDNWTTEQKRIASANDDYIQAILSADLDLLMTFYTEDATLMPPLASPVVGKHAVRANWSDALSQVDVIEAISVFDEIIVLGDWAYGRGQYKGRSKPVNGGAEIEERLNFSGMWHREPDGSWKIARDMWNTGVDE